MRNRKIIVIILCFMVLVANVIFSSTEAKAASTITAPAAKAVSSSYTSIKTSWGAVAGASGYRVYRATSSTGTYTLMTTTTATSYNDTGLATGKTYYYKVRGYTLSGTTKVFGSYSPIVSAKPIPATPAAAKAVSSSYTSIKTSWGAVAGVSGYRVYRATSSTGTYTLMTTTTATSYSDTGLATGKTYYYKVRGYTLSGTTKVFGSYSPIVSAKPIPARPASVKAVSSSYMSIKTSWGAVAGASGYSVYRATSSTGTYTLMKTTTATSYNDTGLTTSKTYYYKVRAYKLVGTTKVYGSYSSVVSALPKPALNPDYSVIISDTERNPTIVVVLAVVNEGTKTLRINSDNAYMQDDFDTSYNRNLQLIDLNGNALESIDIPPGGTQVICFGVIGDYTRYNQYTCIYYEFTYDSVVYRSVASSYYGCIYLKK